MTISDPFRNPTGVIPRVRTSWIAGGAPGDHTLFEISFNQDRILQVIALSVATDVVTPTELTAEFSITADDTINNAGGTDTTGDALIVTWNDHDWGEQEDALWQE